MAKHVDYVQKTAQALPGPNEHKESKNEKSWKLGFDDADEKPHGAERKGEHSLRTAVGKTLRAAKCFQQKRVAMVRNY